MNNSFFIIVIVLCLGFQCWKMPLACLHYYPRMVPPKRKGDLELRRKKVFHLFCFMKSDVGSLALLDIKFSHGEERVFEMHLRLGPLLFLGHLALGTYHLCLRISALTLVMYVGSLLSFSIMIPLCCSKIKSGW